MCTLFMKKTNLPATCGRFRCCNNAQMQIINTLHWYGNCEDHHTAPSPNLWLQLQCIRTRSVSLEKDSGLTTHCSINFIVRIKKGTQMKIFILKSRFTLNLSRFRPKQKTYTNGQKSHWENVMVIIECRCMLRNSDLELKITLFWLVNEARSNTFFDQIVM